MPNQEPSNMRFQFSDGCVFIILSDGPMSLHTKGSYITATCPHGVVVMLQNAPSMADRRN